MDFERLDFERQIVELGRVVLKEAGVTHSLFQSITKWNNQCKKAGLLDLLRRSSNPNAPIEERVNIHQKILQYLISNT